MKKKKGIEISDAEKKWFERTMRWLEKQDQVEKIGPAKYRTTEKGLRAARLWLRQVDELTRIIEKIGPEKFREWREMGKESASRRKVQ